MTLQGLAQTQDSALPHKANRSDTLYSKVSFVTEAKLCIFITIIHQNHWFEDIKLFWAATGISVNTEIKFLDNSVITKI